MELTCIQEPETYKMAKRYRLKWAQLKSIAKTETGKVRQHSNDKVQIEMDDNNTESEIDNRLPYRKGWPKPLPILPLDFKQLPAKDIHDLLPNLEETEATVRNLLQRHSVEFRFCYIANRFNVGRQPAPENTTMVLHCKGMKNLSFSALVEVRSFLQNSGWRHSVEFIDIDEADAPFHCVSPDDPIVREWEESIKQRVLHIIDDLEWQTVDVFHCGTATEKEKCPITVIISAWDAISDVWWEHVLPNIRAECGLNVRLLQASSMQTVDSYKTTTRVDIESFNGPLGIGGSIGPLGNNGTGTLGGFIELEWPDGTTEWLGLSNHHVVKEDRLTEAIKTSGYLPPTHQLARDSSLQLVSPTDHDTDTWLSSITNTIELCEAKVNGSPEKGIIGLEEKVEMGETSRIVPLQRTLDRINNLRENYALIQSANREAGFIIATSGNRNVGLDGKQWYMDWALVRPPMRRDIDTTFDTHHGDWSPLDRWSSKLLMEDSRVFKKGRTTGYTESRVNAIETAIKIPKTPTSEGQSNSDGEFWQGSAWAIRDRPGTKVFSDLGDSGSLILDFSMRVIGLLFARQNSLTYFIPIAAVLKDIESVTGGRVLTPRKDTAVLEDQDA